jgi:hypothetical protein
VVVGVVTTGSVYTVVVRCVVGATAGVSTTRSDLKEQPAASVQAAMAMSAVCFKQAS